MTPAEIKQAIERNELTNPMIVYEKMLAATRNLNRLDEFGDIGLSIMENSAGDSAYWLERLAGPDCGEGMEADFLKFNAWIERFYRENF